jgi:enoyl-CoA hydratase/carnithine racemase
MPAHIETHLENRVFTLSINRPDKMNALNAAMYGAMADALTGAASNPEINVVVIRGGDNFTAGYDLADLLENPPVGETSPVFRFMFALSECPLPVIAMIDGAAVGIGVTLLLHCDFVYATPEAEFLMPFVNLGAVPEFGASQILPLRAGYLKAAELLMFADKFDSKTALDAGIITAIHDRDELESAVANCIRKLASKSRTSIISTKALLKRDIEPLSDRIRTEAAIFTRGIASPEAQGILKAFLKR